MKPEFIHCAECGREWQVSEEDGDATLSDCMGHVRSRHPDTDPWTAIKEGKAKVAPTPDHSGPVRTIPDAVGIVQAALMAHPVTRTGHCACGARVHWVTPETIAAHHSLVVVAALAAAHLLHPAP